MSYSISAAQTGKFSWAGLGKSAVAGAVVGGLTAGLTEGASGATDAASALSSRAADEAASATTEAAATADSSGRAAAEDAASRSGGEEPAESEKSESCLAGGQSFSAGTKVLTASGALVAISKLQPGQKVLATSTKTGKTQAEPVAAVLVHYDIDLYDLKVRTTAGTSVIHTTSSHLFWNQTTGRWTKAGALKHGTHLRTPAGGSAAVVGGWTPKATTGWMWDLTIPTDHDFYIQTSPIAVLVHNCPARDDVPIRGGVYTLRDPETGAVVRTGKASILRDRMLPHARDPQLKDFDFGVEYVASDENTSVGLEQMLYEMYPEARVANGGFNKSCIPAGGTVRGNLPAGG